MRMSLLRLHSTLWRSSREKGSIRHIVLVVSEVPIQHVLLDSERITPIGGGPSLAAFRRRSDKARRRKSRAVLGSITCALWSVSRHLEHVRGASPIAARPELSQVRHRRTGTALRKHGSEGLLWKSNHETYFTRSVHASVSGLRASTSWIPGRSRPRELLSGKSPSDPTPLPPLVMVRAAT